MGGHTANPTYADLLTDTTGHAEVVQVAFDATQTSYEQLLELFWALPDHTSRTAWKKRSSGPNVRTRSAAYLPFFLPACLPACCCGPGA